MKRILFAASLCLALCACQTEEGGVVNKVLTDFGVRKPAEGTAESDKLSERLSNVGAVELKRLNIAEQHGQVKFQKEGELKGKYYKEVKVYESFYPTDVQPVTRSSDSDRGFQGTVEFAYRIYQSARKGSSTEAAAANADIPTDTVGRDSFRYNLGATGEWDNGKGERARGK